MQKKKKNSLLWCHKGIHLPGVMTAPPKQVLRCWSQASTAAIEVLSRLLVQDQQTDWRTSWLSGSWPLHLLCLLFHFSQSPVQQLSTGRRQLPHITHTSGLSGLHVPLHVVPCILFFFFCISSFVWIICICVFALIICCTMTSFHTFILFSPLFFHSASLRAILTLTVTPPWTLSLSEHLCFSLSETSGNNPQHLRAINPC